VDIFESQPVETAIGLILLFFVIALASSSLVEIISQVFKIRANDLENTLGQMLAGEPVTAPEKVEDLSPGERALLGIPDDRQTGNLTTEQQKRLAKLPSYSSAEAIAGALGAFKGTSVYEAASAGARRGLKRGKPSYLAARSFAEGVVEMLGDVRTPGTVIDPADFELVPSGLRRRISSLAAEAETVGGDAKTKATAIKAGLESWFDDTMARAEGAYRRWTRWWILGIGLVIAVAANASAFHVADRLWHDPATRSAVVSAAGRTTTADTPPAGDVTSVAETTDELTELKLPVGWDQDSKNAWNELKDFSGSWGPWTMIAGWLVTALLVTLGAPFWFGLLTKLVSLRSTGAKPPPAGGDSGSATTLQAEAAAAPIVAPVLDADAITVSTRPVPTPPLDESAPDPDMPRKTIASVFGVPMT
jgi:hypothetical protein